MLVVLHVDVKQKSHRHEKIDVSLSENWRSYTAIAENRWNISVLLGIICQEFDLYPVSENTSSVKAFSF